MSQHSRFAPSSAYRIATCLASLRACEGEVCDGSTKETVEGTIAHYAHEQWVATGKRPDHLVDRNVWNFLPHDALSKLGWQIVVWDRDLKVTEEMLDTLEESVLRCLEAPGEHYPERRVYHTRWCPDRDEHGNPMPEQGGTSDHFAIDARSRTLTVDDLKYGQGVVVKAKDNYQGILYALGVIEEFDWLYDFDKVVIRIMQPRVNNYDVWETTKEELFAVGAWLKERFTLALQPNAPFTPDEKACQFCPRRRRCKALADHVMSYTEFPATATPDEVKTEAAFLSNERLVEIYRMRNLFRIWFNAVEEEIERVMLDSKQPLPGLKLVNRGTHRAWRDPDTVADELALYDIDTSKLYKAPKLVSPAQAEKLLKRKDKAVIRELAYKPVGGPLIAPAEDPRPAYVEENEALAQSHFDDEFED